MSASVSLWLTLAAATSTSSVAPAPSIELVTLAPGDALYSLWGHAALRVIERNPTRDIAYNFGSIDFSDGAWASMAAGHLEAFVVAAPYHRMARVYRDERRSIVRRPLNLRPAEARRLADALAARVRGPGARYRYDHFEDNCATQVADMIDDALGGALSATTAAIAPRSKRALALAHVRHHAGLYVVIDTLLTGTVDRPIPAWGATFLPSGIDALFDGLEHPAGGPLVAATITDFVGEDAERKGPWTWPWVKVYLLFVVPLLALFLRFRRAAAALWCAVAGASGLVIAAGWLLTGYAFLAHNYNALVLPPTHLLACVALLRAKSFDRAALRAGLRAYAVLHLLVLAGLIAARVMQILPQAIDPVLGLALGPAVAMLVRPPRAAS